MSGLAVARALRHKSHADVEVVKPADAPHVWPRSARLERPLTHLQPSSKSSSHGRSPNSSRASSRSSRLSSTRRASRCPETLPPCAAPAPVVEVRDAAPPPPEPKTDALLLAHRLHMDFREVKTILEALEKEQASAGQGGMDIVRFHACLLRVLNVGEIARDVLQEAYLRCGVAEGPIDPAELLAWYRDHIFSLAHAPAGAESNQRAADLTLELAKKHHCSCIDLDKVKQQYDGYDMDRSGQLEYDEFELMMRKLLHATSLNDLPKSRLQRFWQELDKDRNGLVDFAEFTEWYLKYFAMAQENGPIEAFYASFGPAAQRAHVLDAMSQTDSHQPLLMERLLNRHDAEVDEPEQLLTATLRRRLTGWC